MTLATVDADGLPNARMVLLKGYDERGFVFYTNADSQKGRELERRPRRRWSSIGNLSAVRCACAARLCRSPTTEADAYFATRPRLAQIGAWASQQSAPLESRMAFEKAIALTMAQVRGRHGAPAAQLVGLSGCSAHDRVLARPALSTA